MTVAEAKSVALHFLRGDNSNAEITDTIVELAIKEVAIRCEPLKLVNPYSGIEIDVFRKIIVLDDEPEKYIREPVIVDTEELDIDKDLQMAVVFFICAYLSNKNKDYYEAKAEKLIAIYKSNNLNMA